VTRRDGLSASRRLTAPTNRVLSLTIVDQGASSISNFALAVIVAHYSHEQELGIFALLTVTYVIAQGVVRGLTSDCLLTRTENDDITMADYEQSGYLWAFIVAIGLSVLIAGASTLLTHDLRLPFLIFAACFPFMALQDFSRFVGISRHNPEYAIWLDSAWIVGFAVAVTVLLVVGWTSLPWLWASWTASGAAVGLWTIGRQAARRGRRRLLRFWLESERALGLRFTGQYLLIAAWIYSIYYPLTVVTSVDTVGRIKLAQLALGPITVLITGAQSGLISIVARRFNENRVRALRFCLAVAMGIAALTIAWSAVMYTLPIHLVSDVYGPTWHSARSLFLVLGLSLVFCGFSSIATAGLRAIRAGTTNLILAAVVLPLSFALCLGGAQWWSAKGFCIGLVITYGIYGVMASIVLLRKSRSLELAARTEPTSSPVDGRVPVVPDATVVEAT
jgi:O-antigen/teichoic acid export membrane protein